MDNISGLPHFHFVMVGLGGGALALTALNLALLSFVLPELRKETRGRSLEEISR